MSNNVKLGEFSGAASFDSSSITELQKEAQDFTSLAIDSAGQRVQADSLNRPISLLRARFAGLQREVDNFKKLSTGLLDVIDKDSKLVDDLLAALELEAWVSGQPLLSNSLQIKWSYGMGYGRIASSDDIAPVNPATGAMYATRPILKVLLDAGQLKSCLVPPASQTTVQPKDLTWTYNTSGTISSSGGGDWAGLSILYPRPLVTFSQAPSVEVVLPVGGDVSGIFSVSGSPPGGSVPIFVRAFTHPRRNSTGVTPVDATLGSLSTSMPVNPLDQVYIEANISAAAGTNGTRKAVLSLYKSDGTPLTNVDGSIVTLALAPVSPNINGAFSSGLVTVPDIPGVAGAKLSFVSVGTTTGSWSQSFRVHLPVHIALSLPPDSVSVYTDRITYQQDIDFSVNDSGGITFLDVPDGTSLNVRYTELYPAYQCSVDGSHWSPIVMLDPQRPYPDEDQTFNPLTISGGLFPITDELGAPSGLYLKMLNLFSGDYTFVVSTPADSVNPGVFVTLQIDFERPSYLSSIGLEPFTSFPCRVDFVKVQGLTSSNLNTIFTRAGAPGPLLDRPLEIAFSRTLVKTAQVGLYQENYEVNRYSILPTDHLRREALSLLQSSLPVGVQVPQQARPSTLEGAQYDFGVQKIVGVSSIYTAPAVFVAGPYRIVGCPEVLRFDVEYEGSPVFYACYRGLDGSENVIDENVSGVSVTSGSCIVFPWASNTDLSQIVHADIYVKMVFTSPIDRIQKFLIQTVLV